MSIEPATSLSVLSDLDDTFVAWNLAARLLYHFHDDLSRSRPYIAGLGALTLLDGGEAATQFGIGAEAGVSVPIAERVGWRFGGGYYHGFESDDFETRDIFYGLLGISIFLGGDADG